MSWPEPNPLQLEVTAAPECIDSLFVGAAGCLQFTSDSRLLSRMDVVPGRCITPSGGRSAGLDSLTCIIGDGGSGTTWRSVEAASRSGQPLSLPPHPRAKRAMQGARGAAGPWGARHAHRWCGLRWPTAARSIWLTSSGHPRAGPGRPAEPLCHRRLCMIRLRARATPSRHRLPRGPTGMAGRERAMVGAARRTTKQRHRPRALLGRPDLGVMQHATLEHVWARLDASTGQIGVGLLRRLGPNRDGWP